jgi:hypothetical protein
MINRIKELPEFPPSVHSGACYREQSFSSAKPKELRVDACNPPREIRVDFDGISLASFACGQ